MNELMRTSTALVNQLNNYKQRKRQLYFKILGWLCLFGVFANVFGLLFMVYIFPSLIDGTPLYFFEAIQLVFALVGMCVSWRRFKTYDSEFDWLESEEQQLSISYQNHIQQLDPGMLSIANLEQQNGELTQSAQSGQLSLEKGDV